MLHRNKASAFTPHHSPSSLLEASYGSHASFGRTIGAPGTGDSGHLTHPTTSLTKMDVVPPPPRSVDPKLPEAPRGVLGVSSASGAGRAFSPAASANVASTAAVMDVHKRAADAPRQQQAFPTATPSTGAQRKKKWRPHCQHPMCLRPASYAESSDSEPVFCEKHKTSGQQNVVHPNRGDCEFVGCGRVSAYASTEDTRARFCHLHKEAGMVKVRDRIGTRCEEPTCIKQASFAMDGDRYPKFCKDHRQANMINIRNQRCMATGCSRGASFAATGGERGQFCSEHKGENMVNTRRRSRCIAPGCTSREPIYVIDGQQLPKFCVGHRGPDFLLPHPTNKAQCVLPECTRLLKLAARGEEQRLVCDVHEAGGTPCDTQNDGNARPKILTSSSSFAATTTTTTQGRAVVAARGNSSGGGSYIRQDGGIDPNHDRLPPHSQPRDAGISSASPPGAWRGARIPRALRYADTSGAQDGSSIPPNAYHAGTTEQLRNPPRRFDGKRFNDQQPASSKHPRRMEHPGAQPSGGNPAAPAPPGSSSLRTAPSEEAGGFDDEWDSVALIKRKGKGKAYRSHPQSVFPAAYSGTAGTAHAHRRVPTQNEPSIAGVAPSQASNTKRNTGQPTSVQGGGGRREQQQRSGVRLLHMDDPTGTARLDHSLTPPGEKTRPSSAAPPAAMLATVKQEIGAEHETTIYPEKDRGGEASLNTQRVATGGAEQGGGAVEREMSQEPESATPDTMPPTDEEEEEDNSRSTESAAATTTKTKKRRTSSSSSVRSTRTKRTTSLNDTHPSGYNPTPFYYTLVKALTGKRKRP